MPGPFKHPLLGTLSWNADLHSWESAVDLHIGCPIDISLSRRSDVEPTKDFDELIQQGSAMLEWARCSESQIRQEIADELLELYNDTWAPEDARHQMTRTEFCDRITSNSLVLDIDGSGFFYWADDDLFAGHWIELRFNGDLTISEIGLAG